MLLQSGTRLGSYDIVAPIGAGGMGEVYRARDSQLDRDVAIKVLPESFANDLDRLMRFTREAKTLAALNPPNIAAIYGIEESKGASTVLEAAYFGPLAPLERIATLDILRGVALFAILLVNWTVNSLWDNDAWEGFSGAADQIAWWTMHIFLDEKARPMFTFMFGLGFAIQMMRAEDRGVPFVATYARRLAVLFVFGAAHDILTERDTLWSYAIFGFLLLPLRKVNPNLLVVLALLLVLVPFTINAIMGRGYSEGLVKFTNDNNARTVVSLSPDVLDTYAGEYELESEPYAVLITRYGDTLFAQTPGSPGFNDIPIRLFAESETEFFSRSIDGAKVSFVRDPAGTLTGLNWKTRGPKLLPGRLVRPGAEAVDAAALRRVASRDPDYQIYVTGSFAEIVSFRARLFWQKISSYTTNYARWLNPDFAIFLLGLYAGRRRIFHDIDANRPVIRNVMWWGLAFGLAAVAFRTLMNDSPPGAAFRGEPVSHMTRVLSGFGGVLGAPALGIAYIAALTLLLQRKVWTSRLGPVGAVGRMALTNYLMQSVAFVLLFFGYGLGWFGQTGAFYGLLLATALFGLQIVASQWWLRRFRFGPAEWLWRSLTYGKLQPMKIA